VLVQTHALLPACWVLVQTHALLPPPPKHTHTHPGPTLLLQTLPYVLIGVAVDVMFILVKSFEELETTQPNLVSWQRPLGSAPLSLLFLVLGVVGGRGGSQIVVSFALSPSLLEPDG
jgi:hypothetical protein